MASIQMPQVAQRSSKGSRSGDCWYGKLGNLPELTDQYAREREYIPLDIAKRK